MIPATRATPRASPLGTPSPRNACTTAGETSTLPVAVAERAVTSLPDTSTMRAAPDSSRCVKRSIRPLPSADGPVEQQHRHLVTLVDPGDTLRQHDERIGLREAGDEVRARTCLLYTSPSPRDGLLSR